MRTLWVPYLYQLRRGDERVDARHDAGIKTVSSISDGRRGNLPSCVPRTKSDFRLLPLLKAKDVFSMRVTFVVPATALSAL